MNACYVIISEKLYEHEYFPFVFNRKMEGYNGVQFFFIVKC